MPFHVALRGTGSVQLAAYGMADAEHRVEKELRERWPDGVVEIREVRRPEGRRIVEEFTVSFQVRGTIRVDAVERDEAKRRAFREARGRVSGSRYERAAWEATAVEEVG